MHKLVTGSHHRLRQSRQMVGGSLSWQAGRRTDPGLTFRQCGLASFVGCSSSGLSLAVCATYPLVGPDVWSCAPWCSSRLSFPLPANRKLIKNLILHFVSSFCRKSLLFLCGAVRNLHAGVISPLPTEKAQTHTSLHHSGSTFSISLRYHQQTSAGSQTAWRQQASPAGTPGLTKLQQESPWFRDESWEETSGCVNCRNLRASLRSPECRQRISLMHRLLQQNHFYHVVVFVVSLEL